MDKEWCVGGQLVTTLYPSPTPLVGLYIAAATMVCFFCITYDSVSGLFLEKKPFLPCKLFTMNSFTITLLGLATKISGDLTTLMPRAEDQLSKLTSTALMCTSLGFCMPSLGTMSTSERYSNMAALSVTVITMVFNICKQMGTGLIFAFRAEHIIIMVCILLLLLSMWSSAVSVEGLIEPFRLYFRSNIEVKNLIDTKDAKDVEGLENLLEKLHLLNYTGNPQTLLCESVNHHAFGFLCALSSVVVLQAMIRSIALRNLISCGSAVSAYKWSIPMVIVVHSLTIVVGTFSIIYRWLCLVRHTTLTDFRIRDFRLLSEMELVTLRAEQLIFRLVNKIPKSFGLSIALILFVLVLPLLILWSVCNAFLLTLLILWHVCNTFVIGGPIYTLKKFISFRKHAEHHQSRRIEVMKTFAFWSVYSEEPFGSWITKMALEDVTRWRIKRDTKDFPLCRLISKWPVPCRSECALVEKLDERGQSYVKSRIKLLEQWAQERAGSKFQLLRLVPPNKLEYTFSCISLLALSGMLAQVLPSSRREFLKLCSEAFDDSFFDILYYVHMVTYTHRTRDRLIYQMKGRLIKELRLYWRTRAHWFRAKILPDAFPYSFWMNSEESKIDLSHIPLDLDQAAKSLKASFETAYAGLHNTYVEMRDDIMKSWILLELEIIVEFIKLEEFKSGEDLFDSLEKLFVQMLYRILSDLPIAILNEIGEMGPIEMGEERIRKALKFCSQLKLLGAENFKWPLPTESGLKGFKISLQVGPSQTSSPPLVVTDPDCVSQVEAAMVSNAVDGIVVDDYDDDDASLHVAATQQEDYGDTIREVGCDEIV